MQTWRHHTNDGSAVARKRDASFASGRPKMFDFPQPQLGPGVRLDAAPQSGRSSHSRSSPMGAGSTM